MSSESETCERKRREKEKLNGTHVFANVSLNILHKIHVFDILDWFHFLWHFTTATTKEKQQIECLQWLLVHLIRKLHSTIKPNQKSPQFIVHWHSISCIISSKIYTALKRTKKYGKMPVYMRIFQPRMWMNCETLTYTHSKSTSVWMKRECMKKKKGKKRKEQKKIDIENSQAHEFLNGIETCICVWEGRGQHFNLKAKYSWITFSWSTCNKHNLLV